MEPSLEELTRCFEPQELLVVGVGNPLRGDDAAGLKLAEGLAQAGGFELLQCEDVPEKYTREMRTTEADTILVVDAADMGLEPGQIRLVTADRLCEVSISTHKCSLRVLARMLGEAAGKEVLLLGIQPVSVGLGRSMSEIVRERISRFLGSSEQHNRTRRKGPDR